MINLKNVSMRYNLGIERDSTLKTKFINLLSLKRRKKPEDFYALKDISFTVQQGEVLGIIGSNGAGKSTLLKLVSGVMKPTKGIVDVDGVVSPMIELGAGFDVELTARENIYLNGAIMGHSKKFLDEKFDEIVEFSGLIDFIDAPIKNFSSGMTAKLAFSVATIVDPEILIVDEILSVGDVSFQNKSKNKMMGMIKGGTTVLFVSHSLGQIEDLCDRAVWLEKGEMKMIGPAKEVCNKYYFNTMKKNRRKNDNNKNTI